MAALHKLKRVIFEYEDFTEELVYPSADEWLDALNSCITMSDIHGHPMIENRWEKIDLKNEK